MEEFSLRITVETSKQNATFSGRLSLPPGLESSQNMTFSGTVSRGQPMAISVNAIATRLGIYEIRVHVNSIQAGNATDVVFIDLRTTLGSIHHVHPEKIVPMQTGGAISNGGRVSSAATTSGTLRFILDFEAWNDHPAYPYDYDNQPLPHVYLELWDREACCSGDILLKSGYAGPYGDIDWSVSNNDGFLQGTLDPYIVIKSFSRPTGKTENKVTIKNPDNGGYYESRISWGDNQPDGAIVGDVEPGTGANGAPWYILSAAMNGYREAIAGGYIDPPHVSIYWKSGNVPVCSVSCYVWNNGAPYISLSGQQADPDQWDFDIIDHEYGHHVHRILSGATAMGGEHFADVCTHPEVAWSEGFASYFQATAQRKPDYQDADETSIFIDIHWEPSYIYEGTEYEGLCTYGQLTGSYEFSIAGALYDIFDPAEASDDNPNYAGSDDWGNLEGDTYDTIRNTRPPIKTIQDFHPNWDRVIWWKDHDIHNILRDHNFPV